MRPSIFKAHVTMLPRLQAEEQLMQLNTMFAAEGRSMKDGDQTRFLAQIERVARGASARSREALSPAVLEGMGIKTHMAPVKPGRVPKGGG